MPTIGRILYLVIYLCAYCRIALCMYVEGEINTWENWAFIARFCFQSENGQFEYYIEYEESQGSPNLLLYYDTDDQWPAVYKSSKTCHEREAMLKPEQNQILNLTTRFPYKDIAGCQATPQNLVTPPSAPASTPGRLKYTLVVPTMATRKRLNTTVASRSESNGSANGQNKTIEISTGKMTVSAGNGEILTTTPLNYASDSWTTLNQDQTDSNTESVEYSTEFSTFENSMETTSSFSTFPQNFEKTLSTHLSLVERLDYEKPIRKRSVKTKGAPRKVICRNLRRFRTARERWWFIAVSNCHGKARGIHIKYKMLMTNGEPGDYWHEHFSADEFYVLPVLMAFTVAYSFLFLAIVICSIELKSRQLLHTTYKLFVYSVLLQFLGILLKSMAYLKYAVNGHGSPGLKVTGNMFTGLSETSFLLLLLLLAKGYTVTRGRLPLSAGVKVTIFMCLYIVTYISLFIYEAKVFDPGEVLYTYESPAGYGLIILRIVAWCMFIYSTVFTLKHYPEKSNFYYPFNVLGTLWFIAGPAFIISANTYIDKWVRESVVCAVLLFITFGGHLMFLLLTMPSVANKNFPYHVRTTQIGVMERTGGDVLGNNTIEQFNHHAYEPTTVASCTLDHQLEQQHSTMVVPLSRRTEELFEGLYGQQVNPNPANGVANGVQAQHAGTRIRDRVMENVLSWSLAKNVDPEIAISNGQIARGKLTALATNHASKRLGPNGQQEQHNEAENESEADGDNLDEWVKEVPVELFTVSKSVDK